MEVVVRLYNALSTRFHLIKLLSFRFMIIALVYMFLFVIVDSH